MFVIFGMTAAAARAAAYKDIKTAGTLDEVREQLDERAGEIMAGKRKQKLSPVYTAPSAVIQFCEMAEKDGGVRLTVKRKVPNGAPVFNKKKNIHVQRYKWEVVPLATMKALK